MKGKLVNDPDFHKEVVCVSCYFFNCWHVIGKKCDVDGCGCKIGSEDDGNNAHATD